jgi:Uma2 family endonuclease
MSTGIPVKQITANELAERSDSKHFELVNGQLVELSTSGLSSEVAMELVHQLKTFICDKSIGSVYGPDCGFQCFEFDAQRVRRPDVSFIAAGRITEADRESGHFKIEPDFVVEVVSPSDLYSELNEKVSEYLRAGVKVVWVIDPVVRNSFIRRLDGSITPVEKDDVLECTEVIPGFECTIPGLIPQIPPCV